MAIAPFVRLWGTNVDDLSFNVAEWRTRQRYDDADGDVQEQRPANARGYWLYFPDDGTFGKESHEGLEGFWLRSGRDAEVLIRTLEPINRLNLGVMNGTGAQRLQVRLEERIQNAALPPGRIVEWSMPISPGFVYRSSFVHVLRFEGTAVPTGERSAFVRISLEFADPVRQ